jgi:hypothetical protein
VPEAGEERRIGAAEGRSSAAGPLPPSGLLLELLARPERTEIRAPHPRLSWIVEDARAGVVQTAYRVLVASREKRLARDRGDLWDSGRVASGESTGVRYGGSPLPPRSELCWKVRTWNACGGGRGRASPWSEPQRFRTGALREDHATARYPIEQVEVEPARVVPKGPGRLFVDFGRAAFGTLELELPPGAPPARVRVALGEAALPGERLDPRPGGSVVYREAELALRPGRARLDLGERRVLPFRYAELEGAPGALERAHIRQVMERYPFDGGTSRFRSSDPLLDRIWDLCKHTLDATSFLGVRVDGERERKPYEGDAYVAQLGHYAVDREFSLARHSHERLLRQPTWPTEWALHSVLMAWADWLYTGHPDSAAACWRDLEAKTLVALARPDGLISAERQTEEIRAALHSTRVLRDLVDWPRGETDGTVFAPVNASVNAFHYRALVLMGDLARALGREADAARWEGRARRVWRAFNEVFFDPARGVYVDGEGTRHAALHANMFALALGLVPEERQRTVVEFVKGRGMACSPWGAQYLLEALYQAGEGDAAFALLTSRGPRSWAHMLDEVGSTMTLEAWDARFKPNLDWSHVWATAPAHIVPRKLMGVEPLEPAFARLRIRPQPGPLAHASLDLPTIRGPVHVDFESRPGVSFTMNVALPANTRAAVHVPAVAGRDALVRVDGEERVGRAQRGFIALGEVGSGPHRFERKPG